MPAERDIPAEPADGTALYWPEDDIQWATLLIRDDRVPAANPDDFTPEHRWLVPNAAATFEPMTWPQALEWIAETDYTLDNAIRLTAAERTERPS